MYKVAVICALFAAAANAGSLGFGSAGTAAGQFGQGSYGNGAFQNQAAGAAGQRAQGAQGSQGSQGFAAGKVSADARQASGRYDHAANILAASERTSASASQANGEYDAGFAFGGAQAAQGSQGSRAAAGQFGAAQASGQNYGQQAAGAQGAQQAAQQVVQPLPVAKPVQVPLVGAAYAVPLQTGAAAGRAVQFGGAQRVGGANFGLNAVGAAQAGAPLAAAYGGVRGGNVAGAGYRRQGNHFNGANTFGFGQGLNKAGALQGQFGAGLGKFGFGFNQGVQNVAAVPVAGGFLPNPVNPLF